MAPMPEHFRYFSYLIPWDGYGLSSTIFVSQFAHRVTLVPLARKMSSIEHVGELYHRAKDAFTRDVPETKWGIDHCPAHLENVGSGPFAMAEKNVLATQWELDRLPAYWFPNILLYDRFVAPTSFQADIFIRSGIDASKIDVIPEFVDVDFWSVHPPSSLMQPTVRFITWGVMQERKCPQEIIRAFRTAFPSESNVELTIKTYGEFSIDTMGDERVKVINWIMHPAELRDMINQHDVVVAVARGEGYGCAAIQGMALGKPVILNGAFSQRAFFNEEANFPIGDGPLVPYTQSKGYLGSVSGLWNSINEGCLSDTMRQVYMHRDKARVRGVRARQFVKERFSVPVISKIWEQYLNSLT